MPIAFPSSNEPLGVLLAEPLREGVEGTEQTVNLMRQLVDQALRDPAFIRLASDIVARAPAFDDFAEAEALYQWVRDNIRFTKDPVTKEKLYPPQELLKIRAGDCDDISMLLGAMLMAVGYPARLITVAANANAPDQFSHVYVEGQVGGEWIPMDPARWDSQFGVEPPAYTRKRWWSLSDASYGDLSGMAWAVVPRGLGAYPRFVSLDFPGGGGVGAYRMASGHSWGHSRGLGSYGRVSSYRTGHWQGLGQDSETIATTGSAISDIIRASEGQPLSPYESGVVAAAGGQPGPWASFQTQYTPGAGVPSAGYGGGQLVQPGVSLTGIPSWFWLVAMGLIAFSIAKR